MPLGWVIRVRTSNIKLGDQEVHHCASGFATLVIYEACIRTHARAQIRAICGAIAEKLLRNLAEKLTGSP